MNYQTLSDTKEIFSGTGDGHSIVIGGSMAGLLAGRALADHFNRVTIIERDRFPDGPAPRAGVPQARHLHVLLMRGQIILEDLFPGLRDELIAEGALAVDAGADLAWLTPAGWGIRFQSGLDKLAFSRDLLDFAVRRRLAAFDNVNFLQRCDVTGLLSDDRRVTGVRFRPRNRANEEAAGEETLRADLVVDASGRNSRTPIWLEALGYAPPRETIVNAFLGYASRLYRRPEGFQSDWKGVFVQAAPPARARAGVLFQIEGNRWIVSLGGGDKDYPPTDEAGFREFARSLPRALIYDAIKDAEPLSPIYGHRATENRLRHYEERSPWPDGFVVMGDAVCAFNPVYGQGMTTAALGAIALDECLREQKQKRPDNGLNGLGRRFQKKLAGVNSVPWMLATSEDLRYSGTEGKRPDFATRFMHRYMDRVIRLSTEDADVRLRLLEVFHMLKPPAAMFRPGIIFQMLKRSLVRPARSHHSEAQREGANEAAF